MNKPDWAGIPPVWQAIIQHDEELFKLFLSRGAHVKNVRIHAEPILVAAIQRYLNGDEIRIAKSPQASKKATLEFYQNSIKLLVGSGCSLEEKSTQGFKPLWLAAQANHVDLTKALLDVGAFAYAGPTSTMNDAIKLVNQRLDEGLVEFIQ